MNKSSETTDDSPIENTTTIIDEEEVELSNIAHKFFMRDSEEKSKELEERTKELAKCREDYNNLRYKFGQFWIDRCGMDSEYRNKSVRVQFVDLADLELAKRAKGLFSVAWHVRDIEHIRWKRNPSSDHRIIVFSDDENAGVVGSAINDFELLGERVTSRYKEQDMEDDVTIVIFSEKGSED